MTTCTATYPHPDDDHGYLHSCLLDADHDEILHVCPCSVRWIAP